MANCGPTRLPWNDLCWAGLLFGDLFLDLEFRRLLDRRRPLRGVLELLVQLLERRLRRGVRGLWFELSRFCLQLLLRHVLNYIIMTFASFSNVAVNSGSSKVKSLQLALRSLESVGISQSVTYQCRISLTH